MRSLLTVCLLIVFCCFTSLPVVAQEQAESPVAIAIHGGAGTILKSRMTPDREAAYTAALEEALRAGHEILLDGGTSMDAVIAAIQVMEASPLFNAGRGSVFTNAETVEMDAALMDGATHAAGAVTGVTTVKSPIALAERVMRNSPHVMMSGAGAEAFADEQELDRVPNTYFHTERRLRQVQQAKARMQESTGALRDQGKPVDADAIVASAELGPLLKKYGTVGAVALDQDGNLAAGTSTGGMTNKRFGRIGDVPVIGAGTYADNETVAISATGHGEYFIRGVVAHDVAAMMRYAGLTLVEAGDRVIMEKLTESGGTGGIISIDRTGAIHMPFNTPGMYRGAIHTDGSLTTGMYKDE